MEVEWNALVSTSKGFTQRPALSLKQKFTRLVDTIGLAKRINAEIHDNIAASGWEIGETGEEDELQAETLNSLLLELLHTGPQQGAVDSLQLTTWE